MPQIAPQKARNNTLFALSIVFLIFMLFIAIIWDVKAVNLQRFFILLIIGVIVCYRIFIMLTAKYRKRSKVLSKPFPKTWRKLLQENVIFYNALQKPEKERFERNVQIFLAEKRITGIKTVINDKDRILVAASAIIPIFGFTEWEYDNLGEILIYPDRFSKSFEIEGHDRNVLGMVGTGVMSGIMILSRKALLEGFSNAKDGKNTAIHEFVHLIDAQDGAFDGMTSLLDKSYIVPWLNLMYQEIDKIKTNKSKINPYGATNEVEFLAVVSEYFFEKPFVMKKHYPELYEMLTKIFHQDLTNKFAYQLRDLMGFTGKKIKRNAPCPCGSGEKYKHCCLKP